MKIAVEGCCHGELDKIYETIAQLERTEGVKVDLLLCCGDFQAVRNPSDLRCMAVPPKYQLMNTFYKYYSGEKKAPILTIFIGGNHEASNYLQELSYGGWVAPNIYYLGNAGIVQIGGIRIGGLSGIYKPKDYQRGLYEHIPYTEDSKRSVYHIRYLDVFRLKQISRSMDIFMTHDWPKEVWKYGNFEQLLRFKPFFKDDMNNGSLGSAPAADLLEHLKPSYWFSAHLHCKFAARIQHEPLNGQPMETKFLALDKCLPKRRFLQLIDIAHDTSKPLKLELDPEWLSILKSTNHLMKTTSGNVYMPGPGSKERYDFTVTDEEITDIQQDFGGDLTIPENFERVAKPYHSSHGPAKASQAPPARIHINPQTTLICEMLDITDPITYFTSEKPTLKLPTDAVSSPVAYPDEIPTDEDESGSSSREDEDPPTYDSFIMSHDASTLGLSSSRLDESLDEKYVTACQSMSELSHNTSLLESGTTDLSQDESVVSSSSPHGMLSPPQTSAGEDQASSSDKDSSAYLSPVLNPSPKRSLDEEPEPSRTLFSSPKAESQPAATTETKPKKFKRRNRSIYESTD